MTQYIDKEALVAQIKRLRDIAFELYGCSQFDSAYNNVLKSIDTLEVIEVREKPERRNPYSSQIDTDTCWDDGNF